MHGAEAWVTVNVRPAIVMVPVRTAAVGLAATVKFTVPLPDPLAPAVTLIHAALLVAVQPQPLSAMTSTAPVPPVDGTD